MSDSKTCGCDPAKEPLTIGDLGHYVLVINCKSVTFNIKESEIKLDKQYLDDIDTLKRQSHFLGKGLEKP